MRGGKSFGRARLSESARQGAHLASRDGRLLESLRDLLADALTKNAARFGEKLIEPRVTRRVEQVRGEPPADRWGWA